MVDRTIQTLKKDLAGEVARHGGKWDDHIAEATEAYNARPHEAAHAAPEDVETQPATQFRVLQDNADKFLHNKKLTESRQRRLQEAGAFRAARRQEELRAQVRGGEGTCGIRLHDCAGYGRH